MQEQRLRKNDRKHDDDDDDEHFLGMKLVGIMDGKSRYGEDGLNFICGEPSLIAITVNRFFYYFIICFFLASQKNICNHYSTRILKTTFNDTGVSGVNVIL